MYIFLIPSIANFRSQASEPQQRKLYFKCSLMLNKCERRLLLEFLLILVEREKFMKIMEYIASREARDVRYSVQQTSSKKT